MRLALLVLAIAVLACAEHAVGQETVSQYHSERERFSVSLPSTWEKQEQDMGQGVWGVFLLSPKEGTSDIFLENITIIVFPADTSDLSEANSRAIQSTKQSMAQFALLNQTVGEIGPHSASWFTHTASFEGHTMKALKYTLINGSTMYGVSCTALAETFDHYRPAFESIVASIAFDEPTAPRSSPSTDQSSAPTDSPHAANVGRAVGTVIGVIVVLYILLRRFRKMEKGTVQKEE